MTWEGLKYSNDFKMLLQNSSYLPVFDVMLYLLVLGEWFSLEICLMILRIRICSEWSFAQAVLQAYLTQNSQPIQKAYFNSFHTSYLLTNRKFSHYYWQQELENLICLTHSVYKTLWNNTLIQKDPEIIGW